MTVDVLVVGGSGFVGGRVLKLAADRGLTAAYTYAHEARVEGFDAYSVDLECDDGALEACLAETCPKAVIYCAVPGTGQDEKTHHRISVQGVECVLRGMRPGTRLVYVSTNAVFSGWNAPYHEGHHCEERSDRYRAYGLMRACGEQVVLSGCANAVVVRTAHVEGLDAQGKLNWRLVEVIDRLRSGEKVARYTDRLISPTWVQTLAEGLLEVSHPDFDYHGVLHIAGSQALTDYTYARALARVLGVDEALICQDLMVPEGSGGTYSLALDVSFTQSLLKTPLLGIETCIRDVLER